MPAETEEDRLGIYFLDVGQGDCTFIVPPAGGGAPILFDCADEYVASRFVANHAIESLSAVVVSHLDIDHIRGILPFLEAHFRAGRRVERLVLGLDRDPEAKLKKTATALLAAALKWDGDARPHKGFTLSPPFRAGEPALLLRGADWSVELVLPYYAPILRMRMEGGEEPNRCSAVLRVSRGDSAVLVGGDATLGSWERLDAPTRAAAAIRGPHHGGDILEDGKDWDSFEHLYEAVGADLAVFSVGTNNRWDHPRSDHSSAACRGGAARLLCTQLTPQCHSDPLKLRRRALSGASGVEFPYRHRAARGHPKGRPSEEVPCAGSVVVWLNPDGSLDVEPAEGGWHGDLLDRVEAAMCGASA